MIQTDMPVLLHFKEVNQETWADLERLFEARGGPKNCWCMVWRAKPAEIDYGSIPGTVNIVQQEVLVQTGENAVKLLDIEVEEKRLSGAQISNYFQNGKVTAIK